jgi:hypothetical protein
MFGIFKKKRNVNLEVIERIESVQLKVNKLNLFKVGTKLDKLISMLDVNSFKLNQEQVDVINRYLNVMETHLSKVYEDLLINKCIHIEKVITDGVKDKEDNLISNEDVIYRLIGELNECDTQVKDISSRMQAALGVNKNLWCMLKSQRDIILGRVSVLNKNFQTILKNQNNVAMAEEVRHARDVSEKIFQSTGMVNYEELETNAGFMTDTENEVQLNSDRVEKIFEKNFSFQSDDYAYEKALEEAMLNKSVDNNEKKGATTPD